MEYRVTIGLKAESQQEANQLVEALLEIKNCLSNKDLLELAKLLKEKPGIVKTAKKFLG